MKLANSKALEQTIDILAGLEQECKNYAGYRHLLNPNLKNNFQKSDNDFKTRRTNIEGNPEIIIKITILINALPQVNQII